MTSTKIGIAMVLAAALLGGCKDGKGGKDKGSSKYGRSSGVAIQERAFGQPLATFESETTVISVEQRDTVGAGETELKAAPDKTFALVRFKWKNQSKAASHPMYAMTVNGPNDVKYAKHLDAGDRVLKPSYDTIPPGGETERVDGFEVPKADYASGALWVYVTAGGPGGYAIPITGK